MLALIVLSPALVPQFVLPDDHGILALAPSTIQHPQIPRPLTAFQRAFEEDPVRGRFRPMSVLIRYAQIYVLRDLPIAWHLVTLAAGIASAWLLYSIGRRTFACVLPAVLLSAWLLVTPGMSFTADTSTFTWDVGYVLTATAAGLCKESFSLALPALALWRVLVNRFDAREPRQAPTFGQMSSGVGYLILVSDDFAAS
jgi:hypothetical protein